MGVRLVTLAQAIPWQTAFSCLLAVTGLGLGLWLRILFFQCFPDPFPTPDTWSYLTGAFGLLEKGQFELYSQSTYGLPYTQRTPGFPLLVWLTLALFKSFAALNLVHGALTLLAALAIGFVARTFGGPWRLPAALAMSFLAVHPHLLYWEHFVLTEGSFQAFFALSLSATALTILRPTSGRAAIAGVFTAISVLIRPQGAFLTPLMLLAVAWAGHRLGWRKRLWQLAAAGTGPLLLLGAWSARNAAVHGYFGSSNIGPLVNFGVAARWIELERPALAEDKALIADSIRRYRSMPDDVNWVQYAPEGPAAILWRKYASAPHRRDQVLNELAREAMLHHPVAFIGRGLSATYKMVTGQIYYDSGYNFMALSRWDQYWMFLAQWFPVDNNRAALDQTRFPLPNRMRIFTENVLPALTWQTIFVRTSIGITLLALLALPLLSGPRRLAVALAAISVVLLILTAGFFSEPTERYLSGIHGGAALAGALVLTGLIERWQDRLRSRHYWHSITGLPPPEFSRDGCSIFESLKG